MNRYEEQTNFLDDLTRCLGVDIANYSIEESTDIEDEERRTMLRSLVFSRGMNEYELLINPYGQIRHFDSDTPPDLIQQMNNSSICFTHLQLGENGTLTHP